MSDKTKEQLEEMIRVKEILECERKTSDSLYAPMVIKVIVYGMVGIILTTVFVALLSGVITKLK